MSLIDPYLIPRADLPPHDWQVRGNRYECRHCLRRTLNPSQFGCPGRQGRPAPEDRVMKERA